MRRNYSVEANNSSSNPLHHSGDATKLIFKIIFILQLRSVKYFISSSYYKVGKKKHFCINTNCCKSLFRNFIIIAIWSRLPFQFMKLLVILMIAQGCFVFVLVFIF